MSRTINVSPSLLADVLVCETKGWSRHVKGYTSPGEAIKAVAGQAWHAGTAEYFNPNQTHPEAWAHSQAEAALKTLHAIYDPAFARCPADKLPDQAYTPDNLHRLFARWMELHPAHQLPWARVLTVEEAFVSRTWTIGDTEVRLICRPDLICEDGNSRVRWTDTKTTGWRISDKGWQQALRLSLQAALYTDAVVQKYGERAYLGGWFSAVEIRNLPGANAGPPKLKKDGTPAKPRTCAEHGVPYAECGNEHAKAMMMECPVTPERVSAALRDAERAAVRFVDMHEGEPLVGLDMRGAAKGECRFCPAAGWCEAGRVAEALPSFMVHDPWIVSEGTR